MEREQLDAFDIGRLSDFDFEILCKDIFEDILKLSLEIFTPGPDAGIDLRHSSAPDELDVVIQCKHWWRSDAKSLIRHIKNRELRKVDALAPKRYILVTSVELSKSAKDELVGLLAPHVLNSGDIYGLHEVVSELRARPKLVRQHFRLWLSSATVLQSTLNQNILTRSAYLENETRESVTTYAPNESYSRAREILEDHHAILISGIPGIGKTTLAHVLLAGYAKEGFAIFEVSRSVEDAYKCWSEEEAQVFYYDDFLGQTSLQDKLSKNEDAKLLALFKMVNRSTNKRLILTTREYLLEQARISYELIARQDFSPWNCILSMDLYSRAVRGQILYNHLHFSALSARAVHSFSSPQVHDAIIDHPNFNPRLISQSIAVSVAQSDSAEALVRRVSEALDNPSRLWDHIVDNQLEPTCTYLLVVLSTLSRPVFVNELESALKAFAASQNESFGSRDFTRSMKILLGTMIQTDEVYGLAVDFHNPSIEDYMSQYLKGNSSLWSAVLNSARYFEQIHKLFRLDEPMREEPRSFLFGLREELSSACFRTFPYALSGHDIKYWNLYEEEAVMITAARAIDIALHYRLDDFAVHVARRVMQMGEYDFDNWEEVALNKYCDYVNIASLFDLEGYYLKEVDDSIDVMVRRLEVWFRSNLSDWHGAYRIHEVLKQVDGFLPDDLLEELEQVLMDSAARWFRAIADNDETVVLDEHQLEWLFEYANSFPDRESKFSYYGQARAAMGDLVGRDGLINWYPHHAQFETRDQIDVGQLFLSLRDPDDA